MKSDNLRITQLLHDITQLGYEIQFCGDFENMIRIEYRKEWDENLYHHEHRGYPDGTMNQLEKEIYNSLSIFLDEHKETK